MKHLIPITVSHGKTKIENWWKSFSFSIPSARNLDEWCARRYAELRKYNATIGGNEKYPYDTFRIVFATEEDATLFLLRWS